MSDCMVLLVLAAGERFPSCFVVGKLGKVGFHFPRKVIASREEALAAAGEVYFATFGESLPPDARAYDVPDCTDRELPVVAVLSFVEGTAVPKKHAGTWRWTSIGDGLGASEEPLTETARMVVEHLLPKRRSSNQWAGCARAV